MVGKWIQGACCRKKKKGALHRQLGIPKDKTIPKGKLREIQRKKTGQKVRVGGKSRTVTTIMKRRANFALTEKGRAQFRKR